MSEGFQWAAVTMPSTIRGDGCRIPPVRGERQTLTGRAPIRNADAVKRGAVVETSSRNRSPAAR